MPDTSTGTAVVEDEAQNEEEVEQTAPETGTPPAKDEVTLLRSRNAGLDAKVTSLSQQAKDAVARAEAAEARALALAEGKEIGDQELRAQLEAQKLLNAELAKKSQLARVEAKYPETFAVLGDHAASLDDATLAASEARFAGAGSAEPPETPVPVGANPGRTPTSRKAVEDMTVAELEKHILGMDPSAMGLLD
jgi:hypothetical protein